MPENPPPPPPTPGTPKSPPYILHRVEAYVIKDNSEEEDSSSSAAAAEVEIAKNSGTVPGTSSSKQSTTTTTARKYFASTVGASEYPIRPEATAREALQSFIHAHRREITSATAGHQDDLEQIMGTVTKVLKKCLASTTATATTTTSSSASGKADHNPNAVQLWFAARAHHLPKSSPWKSLLSKSQGRKPYQELYFFITTAEASPEEAFADVLYRQANLLKPFSLLTCGDDNDGDDGGDDKNFEQLEKQLKPTTSVFKGAQPKGKKKKEGKKAQKKKKVTTAELAPFATINVDRRFEQLVKRYADFVEAGLEFTHRRFVLVYDLRNSASDDDNSQKTATSGGVPFPLLEVDESEEEESTTTTTVPTTTTSCALPPGCVFSCCNRGGGVRGGGVGPSNRGIRATPATSETAVDNDDDNGSGDGKWQKSEEGDENDGRGKTSYPKAGPSGLGGASSQENKFRSADNRSKSGVSGVPEDSVDFFGGSSTSGDQNPIQDASTVPNMKVSMHSSRPSSAPIQQLLPSSNPFAPNYQPPPPPPPLLLIQTPPATHIFDGWGRQLLRSSCSCCFCNSCSCTLNTTTTTTQSNTVTPCLSPVLIGSPHRGRVDPNYSESSEAGIPSLADYEQASASLNNSEQQQQQQNYSAVFDFAPEEEEGGGGSRRLQDKEAEAVDKEKEALHDQENNSSSSSSTAAAAVSLKAVKRRNELAKSKKAAKVVDFKVTNETAETACKNETFKSYISASSRGRQLSASVPSLASKEGRCSFLATAVDFSLSDYSPPPEQPPKVMEAKTVKKDRSSSSPHSFSPVAAAADDSVFDHHHHQPPPTTARASHSASVTFGKHFFFPSFLKYGHHGHHQKKASTTSSVGGQSNFSAFSVGSFSSSNGGDSVSGGSKQTGAGGLFKFDVPEPAANDSHRTLLNFTLKVTCLFENR